MISINLDTERGALDRFVREFAPPWPVICSGSGFDDETAKLYDVRDLPSVWLVDRKGTLRHCFLWGEKLRTAVKELLAEKSLE